MLRLRKRRLKNQAMSFFLSKTWKKSSQQRRKRINKRMKTKRRKKRMNLNQKKNKRNLKGRGKALFIVYAGLVMAMTLGTTVAFAAEDPITVVNNLSTFIFGLIRAIGLILLGFGIVQVDMSLKFHDPSQRANGFLTLAGGIIITFTKEILDLIVG